MAAVCLWWRFGLSVKTWFLVFLEGGEWCNWWEGGEGGEVE